MKFDFDKVTERHGTNSLKYDFAKERGMREDILPLWVADMDFPTAPAVLKRLEQSVEHGIFGYSEVKEDYYRAVSGWYRDYFGWETEQKWLVKTPGVVFAIATAIRAFTEKGDAVLLQQPVYYPFLEMIEENGRVPVNNPLKLVNGRYQIDFEDFERKITENKVKLFLFCSPHNPVGRVWEKQELEKLGEICLRHQVIVVSDEIHSDFVWPGHTHTVFASLSDALADCTITCTAPSKTFNLAGIQVSNIFISNPALRRTFQKELSASGYSQMNLMGLVACQAAYEEGREWLDELKAYLKGNLDFLREYIRTEIPEITLIEPEGTYLIWLDFRGLHLTEQQLENLIVNKANLWLDRGAMFGAEGEGFERINLACPRVTLETALVRLKNAVRSCLTAEK